MRNFTLWGILVTLFAFIGNVNAEVITIDGANEIANNFFAHHQIPPHIALLPEMIF